jgi:hypothetical protein
MRRQSQGKREFGESGDPAQGIEKVARFCLNDQQEEIAYETSG